jgi:glucose-1-phosphate thymidylyltransferase
MKGIILAGGTGSRMHPITLAISKQLMPIYDKPMIYYPLAVLMSAGIREILIITTTQDQQAFYNLLGDGSLYGCSFSYVAQAQPNGLAQAFILGEKFIGKDKVCLILGDNIFYGNRVEDLTRQSIDPDGGIIFAYHVSDPGRYGVVEFDAQKKAISIEEKPTVPKSNFAVPGIYFYDNEVVEIARNLKPSVRGEYEITDVNAEYLRRGKLKVQILEQGVAWLDTGTFGSMMQASNFVEVVQNRQEIKIGCIEEIAYRMGYIDAEQLIRLAERTLKSGYGQYLLNLLKREQILGSLKTAQIPETKELQEKQEDVYILNLKKPAAEWE